MLDEFLSSPGYQAFVNYLLQPETRWAVLLPGILSIAILIYYARAGRISKRLRLLWLLALPIAYFCARWDSTPEGDQLYTFSAFSVACLILLFRRVYIPPALAYALTFVSLWGVDMTRAMCRMLECDIPLWQFYIGVGGAGARDALFLLPLMTAAAVAYGAKRIEQRGEQLALL